MTCRLIQLAPGAYDLLLDGEIMGSVVRAGQRSNSTVWTAELLEDLPQGKRPAPFKAIEHQFPTLDELCGWLGSPEVKGDFGKTMLLRQQSRQCERPGGSSCLELQPGRRCDAGCNTAHQA